MRARSFFYFLFTLSLNAWAQSGDLTARLPSDLHDESIVIHVNSNFFLTGESLFYKVYCINKNQPGMLSTLSSVAYLELIGEDQQPLTQMKVNLENGTGSGDFFFPGNVASGNYTLIGYTKWMRNGSGADFFRRQITVINPFIRPELNENVQGNEPVDRDKSRTDPLLSVATDKSQYGPREKVTLKLHSSADQIMTLSANIRAFESEIALENPWLEADTSSRTSSKKIKFLPEIRSELISGTVRYKEGGKPLAGELITLSSPAKDFRFRTSRTDSSGRYYFSGEGMNSRQLLLKVLGRASNEFVFENDKSFLGDYSQFAPERLVVNTAMKQLIEKRNLSAQVENVFHAVKKDSVLSPASAAALFGNPDKIYDLDQFTRFPTMEDVFREFITEVVVKIRDGNFFLTMVNSTDGYRFQRPPLVLLDGIPVTDANILMKYDPLLIKTIALTRRHYFYGDMDADGIVSLQTKEGHATNLGVADLVSIDNVTPQREKMYYAPKYDNPEDMKRIPDFRTQLSWNPLVNINAKDESTLIFFTGDITGKYMVEITGITSTGEKIYSKQFFEVK